VRIFVLGPKGMPEPLQALLNKEFITALEDKTVRERLVGFGLDVTESSENTPAHLKKHIDDFAATYGKLIAEMGLKAE
jgi:tripartite-type tricarboxylate transporter receptor subunit TctC